MKKIFLLPAIGTLIALFLLQMSCSTGRYIEDSDASASSTVEQAGGVVSSADKDISERNQFLANTHTNASVECNDCHIGGSLGNDVSTSVCQGCHEDIGTQEASSGWGALNPHYSHVMYNDCGDCHHAHRLSQNQCEACHSFNIEIP